MKNSILILNVLIIWILSCSNGASTSKQSSNVKELIARFNSISNESIKKTRRNKKGKVMFSLLNARGSITSNTKNLTVTLVNRMDKNRFYKLAAYASFFIRAIYPDVGSGTLTAINSKMGDGNYQFEELYTYRELKLQCRVQLLHDGRYKYEYVIIVPHQIITN